MQRAKHGNALPIMHSHIFALMPPTLPSSRLKLHTRWSDMAGHFKVAGGLVLLKCRSPIFQNPWHWGTRENKIVTRRPQCRAPAVVYPEGQNCLCEVLACVAPMRRRNVPPCIPGYRIQTEALQNWQPQLMWGCSTNHLPFGSNVETWSLKLPICTNSDV